MVWPNVVGDRLDDVDVIGADRVRPASHGHGGGVEPSSLGRSIEATSHKRALWPDDRDELSLGDLYPGRPRQIGVHVLPSRDVTTVRLGRELGDPEAAVGCHVVGFWPGPAERRARRDERGDLAGCDRVRVLFKPTRHRLKLTQVGERRNGWLAICDERALDPAPEPNRPHARLVSHPHEELPGVEVAALTLSLIHI